MATNDSPETMNQEVEDDAAPAGEICGDCVRRVIQEQSGRKPQLDDKMSDLFVPCHPDVMARLAAALEQCSERAIEISCGKTVRRIMNELCG